jgi:hypothetical protein
MWDGSLILGSWSFLDGGSILLGARFRWIIGSSSILESGSISGSWSIFLDWQVANFSKRLSEFMQLVDILRKVVDISLNVVDKIENPPIYCKMWSIYFIFRQ